MLYEIINEPISAAYVKLLFKKDAQVIAAYFTQYTFNMRFVLSTYAALRDTLRPTDKTKQAIGLMELYAQRVTWQLEMDVREYILDQYQLYANFWEDEIPTGVMKFYPTVNRLLEYLFEQAGTDLQAAEKVHVQMREEHKKKTYKRHPDGRGLLIENVFFHYYIMFPDPDITENKKPKAKELEILVRGLRFLLDGTARIEPWQREQIYYIWHLQDGQISVAFNKFTLITNLSGSVLLLFNQPETERMFLDFMGWTLPSTKR